jgi:hypothetical protein
VSTKAGELHRRFRNAFEHIDERLEEFAQGQTEGVAYGDLNFVGADPNQLRGWDPSTRTLTLSGESFDLRPLIAELQRLEARSSSLAPRAW